MTKKNRIFDKSGAVESHVSSSNLRQFNKVWVRTFTGREVLMLANVDFRGTILGFLVQNLFSVNYFRRRILKP